MIDLSRLVEGGHVTAEPLPSPFPEWERRGMRLRKANYHKFAAQAGSFKTTIALNAVVNMGVDTLYLSNDSDDTTAMSRLLSIATQVKTSDTEQWLESKNGRIEYAAQTLGRFSHIQWDFNNSPTLDDIWNQLYAYAEVHGVFPELVVVDILMNVAHNEGDEWANLRAIDREMQIMARETKAAVLGIHHVTEAATTSPCPSRKDIMGKGAVREVLIVTFGVDEQQRLFAACVKNRFGKADHRAKDYFEMGLDPATSRVFDHQPTIRFPGGGAGGGEEWWK